MWTEASAWHLWLLWLLWWWLRLRFGAHHNIFCLFSSPGRPDAWIRPWSVNLWLDYGLEVVTQEHSHTFHHQAAADSPAVTGWAFQWITPVYPSNSSHCRASTPLETIQTVWIIHQSSQSSYTCPFGCLTSYNGAVNKTRIDETTISEPHRMF